MNTKSFGLMVVSGTLLATSCSKDKVVVPVKHQQTQQTTEDPVVGHYMRAGYDSTVYGMNILGTETTPSVRLDPVNDIFYIKGRSIPENSLEFYKPILGWLNAYAINPNESTRFTFNLEYFNTSSSKMILDVLLALENIQVDSMPSANSGMAVNPADTSMPQMAVKWYHNKGDEVIKQAGLDYQSIVAIPFEVIDITDRTKSIIAKKFGVDVNVLTDAYHFTNDLGADSLGTVKLIMEFEKEFNIAIPDDQTEKISTVGEATAYIEENAK